MALIEVPDIEVDGVDLSPEITEAEETSAVHAIFREAAPQAALTITQMASGDLGVEGRKARFDAARYVVDRVLGSVAKAENSGENPWQGLKDILRDARNKG